METNKKPKTFKKIMLIIVGVIVALSIIGALSNNTSSTTDDKTNSAKETKSSKSENHEELFAEAQKLFKDGSYTDAIATVEKAIKAENKDEYTKLKADIEAKIKERKGKLEAKFDIKEDKVENITFISPASGVTKGLVFYPYIGVKDSKKYMLLRAGYQEDASKALFVFTSIKVRAGEDLEELKFNPMDKLNNVDFMGSGMTEVVDIGVKDKTENLLTKVIPSNDEVIVRFEDISNKTTDYTLSKEQKQVIADILEYYSYLD
ncbi:hypothetical protein SAMN05661091_1783 [Paenibacillus uliginis N3/975]|uniref:Uncharacterized protein n=1 Tax=Paenibacillus uliginis N3/975 TaxID=1313296 RepID=A0A1X7H4X1_9BACL|nr:hypothetical protein SAMN05661091_1783 [Paenibacillus uliginis N3/975]